MKYYIITLLCAFMLIFSACGENDTSNDIDNDNAGMTGLSLKMTDSATEDYNAVWVTISEIEVQKDGEDSKTVYPEGVSFPITVDLLSLQNGISTSLGLFDLEPGHYTQIRLHLGSEIGEIKGNETVQSEYPPQYANCVYENDSCYELTIPSGYQTGIKLNRTFDIQEDILYELMLDFDARKSVHQTGSGSYKMRPTIRIIKVDLTGIIAGKSEPGAIITAQFQNQDACGTLSIAQTTTADETGNYQLSFLEPKTYTIVAVKDGFQPAIRTNIGVNAGDTNEQDLLLTSGNPFSSISGQVSNLPDEDQAPQVKAITSINDTNVILDHSPLSSEGSYTLHIPPGDYTFYFCAENEEPVLVTVGPEDSTVDASF
ncbi:MAG: DUF4382 domain-containing protein [bacterium]